MLSGDNGILQKATDAKTETEKGQEKEIVALAYNSALAKKVDNRDSTEVTAEDLNIELVNQGASAYGDNPIIIKFDISRRQYTINNEKISEYVQISNIKLDKSTIELEIDEENIITATIFPTNATESLIWNSQDENVATILSNGEKATIIGKQKGETTITVTNGIINESCRVKVKGANLEILANEVSNNPIEYYGLAVKYKSAKWRIFYADDKNIFLISDKYIMNSNIPISEAGLTKKNTYSAYWNSVPTSQAVLSELKSSFMWDSWTNYTSYSNGKCVSTMLNTNNWKSFVDDTYADYAIGGPTIEMFCASWNAISNNKLYCNKKSSYGYYIGTKSSPTTISAQNIIDDRQNQLYRPYSAQMGGAKGYWISSPSANTNFTGGNAVMNIDSTSTWVSSAKYNNTYFAFRPVVRLKSDVKLIENTTDFGINYNLQLKQ